MKSTARFALPYPEDTDPPDGPAQFHGLAEAAEAALGHAGAQSKATIIAGEGTREGAAYGALTGGADIAEGIVLPTKGLIVVGYQATWEETVKGAARAAIFLGANQLKYAPGDASPAAIPKVQEVALNAANLATPLASFSGGLFSAGLTAAYTGDVTTGQIIGSEGIGAEGSAGVPPAAAGISGGLCHIFAAAGTYDVSVQFKASSGKVKAKNRRLYVWTQEFA